jgi:hypothetical protein
VISSLASVSCDASLRRLPRDFSRGGPLNPELLTTLLLYMVADGNRRGYRHLLDGFWDEARGFGLDLPTSEPVSAASFCDARHKITSRHLRRMLQDLAAEHFGGVFGSELHWRGRRVFAVDGTKINLQRGDDLEAAFGTPAGAYCPQVLVSVLLDVCAQAPVDLVVGPFASSERDQLLELLPSLPRGCVLVLDRGYPSHEILQELAHAEVDFLVRLPCSHTFAAVDGLRQEKGDDYLYHVDPPAGSPSHWKRLTLRAVRLVTPDGSESFFFTTLRRTEFSRARLGQLYHLRWRAEEFYKLAKGPYIGQQQFRSRSPQGVRQEIHALVLFLAIARLLMATAARSAQAPYTTLSQKAAVLGLAAYVTRLFLADGDYARTQLRALIERILRGREKPRRKRSYPRRSFQPRLRWGPAGRTGG